MVRKKCPYCDFNSHPIKGDVDQEAYRLALEADWAAQSQTSDVFASVFFGGGTPSLFHPKHIGRLLDKLPIAADAEITLEVNPGTQEYMEFSEYRSAGINRLSVGAQSFDEHKLKDSVGFIKVPIQPPLLLRRATPDLKHKP